MKKMLLFVLVMGFCQMGQAAKFNWGMSAGQTYSAFAGASIYLIYDTGNTANGGLGFNITGLASMTSFTLATVVNGGDYKINSNTMDGTGYYSGTFSFVPGASIGDGSGNNYPGTGTKSFYEILISSDGKSMAYTKVMTVNVTVADLVAQNPRWMTSEFTKVTAVPEPATFALMGVGLAVLGLRRRFMKK